MWLKLFMALLPLLPTILKEWLEGRAERRRRAKEESAHELGEAMDQLDKAEQTPDEKDDEEALIAIQRAHNRRKKP